MDEFVKKGLLGLTLCASINGAAQEKFKLDFSSKMKVTPDRSHFQLQFDSGLQNFISSDTEYFSSRGASENLSFAQLGFKYNKSTAKNFNRLDLAALYSFEEESPYINFKNGHYTKKQKNSEITLGRRKYDWFRQEDVWASGTWFPRYARDKINIENQGLMVAAYTSQSTHWSFTSFIIPLHIPEVGPSFKQENGKLTSENPWFRAPLSAIDFQEVSGETEVNYSVAEVQVWDDIINNQGLGFHAGYRKSNLRFEMGYSYKPMNQILLGFPFEMQIGGPADQVAVELQARIARHHVLGLEAETSNSNWVTRYNATYELPEEDDVPENWISQDAEAALMASSYWGYRFNSNTESYLSLLKVWGGNERDVGPTLVLKEKSYFESRFHFTQALMFGIKRSWPKLFSLPVHWHGQLVYDIDQNGALFSSDLAFHFSKGLSAFFNIDLLGLVSEQRVDKDDGLIRNFRANDQVIAGVSYVF